MVKNKYFSFFKSLLLLIFFSGSVQAQVKGAFLKDTIKIGEPVEYALSYKYPSSEEVLFPDSLYDYSPFELLSKRYFRTKSDSINSLDSVIYSLTTFETGPKLAISIPVYKINNKDCTLVFPVADTIFLDEIVKQLPDSVSLKENTAYQHVNKEFNYPYFIIGALVILVLALILFLIFGKKIRNRLRLRRLRKQFTAFNKAYQKLSDQLNNENYRVVLEHIYTIWKEYLEKIEKQPYSTYTTKEIDTILKNSALKKALNNVDRSVYGGIYQDEIKSDLKSLIDIAEDFYKKKVDEIKSN